MVAPAIWACSPMASSSDHAQAAIRPTPRRSASTRIGAPYRPSSPVDPV